MIQPISRFMAKTTLYHGFGGARITGEEAVKLGLTKVLIVTDKGVRKAGLLGVVEDSLRQSKIVYEAFDDVPEDADAQTCHKIALILRQDYQGVVVVGGGSAICAAKGGAMEATNPHVKSIIELAGRNKYGTPPLPLICLPTTAGSGSDVSAGFPIVDETHQFEVGFSGDHLQPPVSILDPNMLRTCPTKPMIYAGLDALSHAVEALWGINASSLTDTLAYEAIRLIMNNLRAAALTDDMNAKSAQHLAASMANYACGNASLGIVHGLAISVGTIHAPHGLKCAMLLPFGIEFNMPVCEGKFARLAVILGENFCGSTPHELAETFLARVKQLYLDIDFPTAFTPEQLRPENIPDLINEVRRYTPSFLETNLRHVTDADLERIAWAATVGWDH